MPEQGLSWRTQIKHVQVNTQFLNHVKYIYKWELDRKDYVFPTPYIGRAIK